MLDQLMGGATIFMPNMQNLALRPCGYTSKPFEPATHYDGPAHSDDVFWGLFNAYHANYDLPHAPDLHGLHDGSASRGALQ